MKRIVLLILILLVLLLFLAVYGPVEKVSQIDFIDLSWVWESLG